MGAHWLIALLALPGACQEPPSYQQKLERARHRIAQLERVVGQLRSELTREAQIREVSEANLSNLLELAVLRLDDLATTAAARAAGQAERLQGARGNLPRAPQEPVVRPRRRRLRPRARA